MRRPAIAVLGLLLLFACGPQAPAQQRTLGLISPATATAESSLPYGILYRQPASRGPLRETDPLHPLVDGGIVTAWWSDLEPEPGVYDLALAHELLAPWIAAGKPAQLSVHPYGPPGRIPTWWESEGLAIIDDDSPVAWTTPAMAKWDNLLAALRADGLPLSHTLGHLGHGACTTEGGSAALAYSQGWTVESWESYSGQTASPGAVWEFGRLILRDPSQDNYRAEVRAIADQAVAQGAVPIPLIYDADPEKLQPDAETFLLGYGEAGIGDDWPVWVPEDRRDAPATLGRDHIAATTQIRWLMRHGYNLHWLVIGHTELDGATEGHDLYDNAWRVRLSGIRDHLIAGSWE